MDTLKIPTYNKEIPKIDNSLDKKALKEQTDAFESLLLKMLLDISMENQKNLFSDVNDPGEKIYQSMYRDELSKTAAGSFGFSQILFDYLSAKNG